MRRIQPKVLGLIGDGGRRNNGGVAGLGMTSNNQSRVLSDVVSLEAWHDAFGEGRTLSDLHVDVVFGDARVGGETEAPVRFRLGIQRAEIVVIAPPTEPVAVDPRTVSRDAPQLSGNISRTSNSKRAHSFKLNFAALFSARRLRSSELSGGADISYGRSTELNSVIKTTQSISAINTTQSRTSDDHYRWIVSPALGKQLSGRPWDPLTQPRLALIDTRSDKSRGIPPSVRIEIRCRREDLIIHDLKLKDGSAWNIIRKKEGHRNRLAAAEAYIKSRLFEEGLHVGDMEELFSQTTIAAVTADSI